MRISCGTLLHWRSADAQTCVCVHVVSPEPSLFAYMKQFGFRVSVRSNINDACGLTK